MKKTMLFVLAMLASFIAANGAAERGDNGTISSGDFAGANTPFSTFYKREQLRLFTLLDSALSQKAEDALRQNFNAVKKADINYQSKLSGRPQNIGINIIGSFSATDSRAFGWQLRAFGGDNATHGGNAGLFVRRINNNTLVGANAFADYEDGDFGAFSRIGFGGELQRRNFSLAANYYKPVTDDQKVNATLAAFSRDGFDAKLRVNIRDRQNLKAIAEYYQFDGEGKAESQRGIRLGLEALLFDDVNVGILHDSEDNQFGVNVAYSHTFGDAPSRANNNADNFAPDLFAPVSREYSQRIATITTQLPSQVLVASVTAFIPARTITMLGVTVDAATMVVTQAFAAASAHFSTQIDTGGFIEEVTTAYRFLFPFPVLPATRPVIFTVVNRNFGEEVADFGGDQNCAVRIAADNGRGVIGDCLPFPRGLNNYTVTATEGSEMFLAGVPTVLFTISNLTPQSITDPTFTIVDAGTMTLLFSITTFNLSLTALTINPAEVSAMFTDVTITIISQSRAMMPNINGDNPPLLNTGAPFVPPMMAFADIVPSSPHNDATKAGAVMTRERRKANIARKPAV